MSLFLFLLVSGLAAASAYGSSWTFLLTFFHHLLETVRCLDRISIQMSPPTGLKEIFRQFVVMPVVSLKIVLRFETQSICIAHLSAQLYVSCNLTVSSSIK